MSCVSVDAETVISLLGWGDASSVLCSLILGLILCLQSSTPPAPACVKALHCPICLHLKGLSFAIKNNLTFETIEAGSFYNIGIKVILPQIPLKDISNCNILVIFAPSALEEGVGGGELSALVVIHRRGNLCTVLQRAQRGGWMVRSPGG